MTHNTQQPQGPRITTVARFHRYGRRGFTIVEVLVALGILAIGIASVYTLLPVAAILQKQAVDATQGPEFGASVLAVVKQLSKNDTCFGTGSVEPTFKELDAAPRFNLNNQAGRNYNYHLLYRRLVANGPVEVAVMVYRKLPGEEQLTNPSTLLTDVNITSATENIYGKLSTNGTTATPTADQGFMRNSALTSGSQVSGNLLLVGNSGGDFYVTSYTVVDTTGTSPYTLRVSPTPPRNSDVVISLVKTSPTVSGNLQCIAIVTGVIE